MAFLFKNIINIVLANQGLQSNGVVVLHPTCNSMMHHLFRKTLPLLACCLLVGACKKEATPDPCLTDLSKCPPPDLCANTDNCDDGILDELLKNWSPIGGIFEGQSVLSSACINGSCPDIFFTFFKDSTYLIETVKVYPDSSGMQPIVVQGQETGTYRVGDCICYQNGNWWDGYRLTKDGKVYFSPADGGAYQVSFQHFSGGMFLTNSSRDSTLQLFMN